MADRICMSYEDVMMGTGWSVVPKDMKNLTGIAGVLVHNKAGKLIAKFTMKEVADALVSDDPGFNVNVTGIKRAIANYQLGNYKIIEEKKEEK